MAPRGVDDRVQARLVHGGVRDDAEGEGTRGAAAAPRRPPPPVADVRPAGAAHAHVRGLQAPPAVPAALDVQGGPRARVPALDRVRPPLPRAAARAVLRHPPPHRQGGLAAEVQPLLRRLADGRLPRRLPRVDAAAALQPVPAEPARTGGGDGGSHRKDRLALPGRRVRVLTAGGREDALRRLVGSQAPRDQHLHRQGPLDVHRGCRDQQLTGLRERKGLLRHRRRQRLRGRLPHWAAALALAGTGTLRAPRVLLRDAYHRVRPRVRREHRRHPLRLRRLERKAAVGPARRQLHLHGGCGLAAAGLHRHVRRSVHGVQRGDRGPALALPGLLRDPRRAERHRRSRLFRRLPPLRPQRLPVVQERRPWHLRLERAHREARLALARRGVQSRRRRQPTPLHRGALARLQLCAEASSRSAQASKKETSTAVKGQIKYEFWKTRPR